MFASYVSSDMYGGLQWQMNFGAADGPSSQPCRPCFKWPPLQASSRPPGLSGQTTYSTRTSTLLESGDTTRSSIRTICRTHSCMFSVLSCFGPAVEEYGT
eukprot:scaffold671705_cov59-Prasinocladus_malaysianus.AAC.1